MQVCGLEANYFCCLRYATILSIYDCQSILFLRAVQHVAPAAAMQVQLTAIPESGLGNAYTSSRVKLLQISSHIDVHMIRCHRGYDLLRYLCSRSFLIGHVERLLPAAFVSAARVVR